MYKNNFNKVLIADNIHVMSNMNNNTVDLIYCDILFGTGNKFQDYEDPKFESYHAIKSFYLPRFKLMRSLLKETGLIYIHCDYNISHYIRILLDKVFGKNNFRNEIIWYYNSAPRKKKDFGKRHDVILRYSVSNNYYFDQNSTFIRQPYSKTAPRGYAKEKYYNPAGKIMDDVWTIPILGQNDKTERVGYSTQKPIALLLTIIDSSCPKNGVVADFFCGSGTTLVAAKKLKRKYIGCDINPKAIEITKNRLKL